MVSQLNHVYGYLQARTGLACMVSWLCPPAGSYKLNVDGSALNNPGRSSFSGLIQNEIGEWMLYFLGFNGISTNLHAELNVILFGLHLAR